MALPGKGGKAKKGALSYFNRFTGSFPTRPEYGMGMGGALVNNKQKVEEPTLQNKPQRERVSPSTDPACLVLMRSV